MGAVLKLMMLVAWLTNVFVCFIHSQWLLFWVGMLIFPVGVVHGAYLWFT